MSVFFFFLLITMASNSSDNLTQPFALIPLNPAHNFITINATTQLPLKLTSLNYFSQKAQFHVFFFGMDLLGYLDGSFKCPLVTIDSSGQSLPNPDYTLWQRQDHLILHAILASISEYVISLVSSATFNHDAWSRLSCLYDKRSHFLLIYLKDKFSLVTRVSIMTQISGDLEFGS